MQTNPFISKAKNQGKETSYPISKRLYTLKEVALYLSSGLYTVRQMIWNGELPVVRRPNGRKMYVDILDLETWLAKNKESSR